MEALNLIKQYNKEKGFDTNHKDLVKTVVELGNDIVVYNGVMLGEKYQVIQKVIDVMGKKIECEYYKFEVNGYEVDFKDFKVL